MAIRIGLTGGIGSGKSVVSRLLIAMGIPVYISDIETRRLMVTDEGIRLGLTSLLGDDVYVDGSAGTYTVTIGGTAYDPIAQTDAKLIKKVELNN